MKSQEYREARGGHLIAFDQSFAPYLADKRILGVAEALWGPYFRVSFTRYISQQPNPAARANRPGQHGEWHADWTYGQRYEGHIIARIPLTRS